MLTQHVLMALKPNFTEQFIPWRTVISTNGERKAINRNQDSLEGSLSGVFLNVNFQRELEGVTYFFMCFFRWGTLMSG